jgi:hypothetical protein
VYWRSCLILDLSQNVHFVEIRCGNQENFIFNYSIEYFVQNASLVPLVLILRLVASWWCRDGGADDALAAIFIRWLFFSGRQLCGGRRLLAFTGRGS